MGSRGVASTAEDTTKHRAASLMCVE